MTIIPELRDLSPYSKEEHLDTDRVWTICELAILRYRDKYYPPQSSNRSSFSELSDQIREIRLSWERK